MIKIVFFDFGNVLVTYEKVFTKICNNWSIDIDDFLVFYDEFDGAMTEGQLTTKQFWSKCIDKFNLKGAKNYPFEENWVADYEIIKPVNKLIYQIAHHTKIGIISNIGSGIWEAAWKNKWVPQIDYASVILSYKEKMKKPDREIYKRAMQGLPYQGNEILFIDDKKENLVEPKKMGWQVMLFDPKEAESGAAQIKRILGE